MTRSGAGESVSRAVAAGLGLILAGVTLVNNTPKEPPAAERP